MVGSRQPFFIISVVFATPWFQSLGTSSVDMGNVPTRLDSRLISDLGHMDLFNGYLVGSFKNNMVNIVQERYVRRWSRLAPLVQGVESRYSDRKLCYEWRSNFLSECLVSTPCTSIIPIFWRSNTNFQAQARPMALVFITNTRMGMLKLSQQVGFV
jgi:hypothetical protein